MTPEVKVYALQDKWIEAASDMCEEHTTENDVDDAQVQDQEQKAELRVQGKDEDEDEEQSIP